MLDYALSGCQFPGSVWIPRADKEIADVTSIWSDIGDFVGLTPGSDRLFDGVQVLATEPLLVKLMGSGGGEVCYQVGAAVV